MARYYGMKVTISGYVPGMEKAIKEAAMRQWAFQCDDWIEDESIEDDGKR